MAKILVAEDDPHISRVVALWLKRNGHEVISASNGRIALELARQEHPDLLVTDFNMPEMDGAALLSAIRDEALIPHQAVVLTSRCDQAEIESRLTGLGAVLHPKPFSPHHLMSAIGQALEQAWQDSPTCQCPTNNT